MKIFVPENGPSHVYDTRRIEPYQSYTDDDGRRMIDVPPAVFRSLLTDNKFGIQWHDLNLEALAELVNYR